MQQPVIDEAIMTSGGLKACVKVPTEGTLNVYCNVAICMR